MLLCFRQQQEKYLTELAGELYRGQRLVIVAFPTPETRLLSKTAAAPGLDEASRSVQPCEL